jgi:hypothetical protein
MDVGAISAFVSVSSAFVAVGALIASVMDGRAGRRNTEFLGHRDMWWQRWTWVAERATSNDSSSRRAAAIMATALVTRDWTTEDDTWVFARVDQTLTAPDPDRTEETDRHDLDDE